MPRFHVARSTTINADPTKVFEAIADFSTWTTWSPWLCAEPEAKVMVSSDSSSVGSTYAWEGELVGVGEIEHLRLEPGKLIEEEIRFKKPMKSVSSVKFELEAAGDGSKVTWHMNGSLPFFLFFMKGMMETFIGMDYARGLKMLKEWIETGEILSRTTTKGVQPVGPLRVVGIRKPGKMSDLAEGMESALCDAKERFESAGLPLNGDVITVYHDFNMKTQVFDYTCGFSLPDSAGDAPSGMSDWSIPEMKALAVEHIGSYEHLGNAWSAGHQTLRYRKLKPAKCGGYEVYRNDPETTKPAELHTDIYFPLK